VYLSEYQLRQEIIWVTRIVTEQGLVRSSDGNISARLDENRFLVTPSGLYKMAMATEDPVIVNWDGKVLKGKKNYIPTSELRMHLEIYRLRRDINAVLHAHPPHCIALTIDEIPFPTDLLPEVLLELGDVPTAPYARPGSKELALSIRDYILDNNAILLSHHGSINVGRTLEEALITLERLEHTARIYYLSKAMGELRTLSKEEVDDLRDRGKKARKGD
jgi:L-fuculose-phosphate aldolase